MQKYKLNFKSLNPHLNLSKTPIVEAKFKLKIKPEFRLKFEIDFSQFAPMIQPVFLTLEREIEWNQKALKKLY